MKIEIKYITIVLFMIVVACGLSCKKTYLIDGGTSAITTPLSPYDYLKNDQYHQFDTVVILIDYFKLKDTVNKAPTLFAFTDKSVHALMKSLNVQSLQQLTDSVNSKLFTQYMFNKTISLDDASIQAVRYTNLAGSSVPCAIKKVKNIYNINLTASAPTFTYYTLQYIKINGVLDDSSGAPAADPVDANLICQTSGIQTGTGTTLHILGNNAGLNRPKK